MHCSFCRKSQESVGRLISNPSDYPRAYICDECVGVCAMILEDDRPATETESSSEDHHRHPLLEHPLASELMECVVEWIRQDSLGFSAANELAQLRRVASQMITPK
jgi:ATP-dependent protease Clp ATPase subunit